MSDIITNPQRTENAEDTPEENHVAEPVVKESFIARHKKQIMRVGIGILGGIACAIAGALVHAKATTTTEIEVEPIEEPEPSIDPRALPANNWDSADECALPSTGERGYILSKWVPESEYQNFVEKEVTEQPANDPETPTPF